MTQRSGMPAEHVIEAADARQAVQALADRGLRGIQAEGGPGSLGRLADEGLLDELCVSVTHRTVGGTSSRMIDGPLHDQSWQLDSLLVGPAATITRYRRADCRIDRVIRRPSRGRTARSTGDHHPRSPSGRCMGKRPRQ